MSFCTVINCMDGRTQLPVYEYLTTLLDVEYVDMITEAGPVKILSEQQDSQSAKSILSRVDISVGKHGSNCITLVSHYDCAGNPVGEDLQKKQLEAATLFLSEKYPKISIIGVWVDSDWKVHQVLSINC